VHDWAPFPLTICARYRVVKQELQIVVLLLPDIFYLSVFLTLQLPQLPWPDVVTTEKVVKVLQLGAYNLPSPGSRWFQLGMKFAGQP